MIKGTNGANIHIAKEFKARVLSCGIKFVSAVLAESKNGRSTRKDAFSTFEMYIP